MDEWINVSDEQMNELALCFARILGRKLARKHHEEEMRLARERRAASASLSANENPVPGEEATPVSP